MEKRFLEIKELLTKKKFWKLLKNSESVPKIVLFDKTTNGIITEIISTN